MTDLVVHVFQTPVLHIEVALRLYFDVDVFAHSFVDCAYMAMWRSILPNVGNLHLVFCLHDNLVHLVPILFWITCSSVAFCFLNMSKQSLSWYETWSSFFFTSIKPLKHCTHSKILNSPIAAMCPAFRFDTHLKIMWFAVWDLRILVNRLCYLVGSYMV